MYLVDKIQMEDIETNDKLLQWSKRRVGHKVLEKVSQELVHRQVEFSTFVTQLETIL